ncbi:MAG: endolytic transglycosylase MltG [Pseudomonadota bacterium]
MRHVAANVISLLALAALVVAALSGVARDDYAAPGPLAEAVIVDVPRGASLREAADRLAAAGALPERVMWGLMDGATLLRLAARYTGRTTALKAGEYRVPAGASVENVLALITSGRSIQYAVTVPEGLTSWEVVELLRADATLTGEIAAVPAEGSLAPDTYFIDRGTERAALIARMQEAQQQILTAAWSARAEGLPLASPEEALILASIIEKETGLSGERAKVASVFINRLNRGMRLETDPTVVYGAIQGQGALDRPPTGPELRRETPWNTYRIDGLPPTPIANPGRAAIEATLNPDATPFIFFVADGTGGHAFAETLSEHNANVRAWRRIEAQRRNAQ